MSERITMQDLYDRCDNVNRRIESSGRYVTVERRYDYVGLDECARSVTIGGIEYRDQVMHTIRCGTKREIGEFLHAMMVGIDLSRYAS